MNVWLLTTIVLFVLVQLVMWVKQFITPLPLYLLGGAFLAIASNYERSKFTLNSRIESLSEQLQGTETNIKQLPED